MIPLLDIRAQYAALKPELDAAVLEVLDSGEYVLGSRVAAFEAAFAAYCGTAESVAVNTGTSALHLALLALDIGPGDEVITVPMTFIATVAAIKYTGAQPVMVDIDASTWTMDPAALERAITPRTRAILPVHLHGRLADMAAILEVARRHSIPVVEDAAQAHGAEAENRRAGAFGDIGCFSFYPGKNLGACGEGGAVVTSRPELATAVRQLRDWGQEGRYNHVRHGFNFRMDGLQGAVLDVKLRHLPGWTARRRAIAGHYDRALAGTGLGLPCPLRKLEHVYHVYALRSPRRGTLRRALAAAGVTTGLHYPTPVHLQPAYADLGYGCGSFPVAEALAEETLSLPIYPEMTERQQQQVCDAVHASLEDADVKHAAA